MLPAVSSGGGVRRVKKSSSLTGKPGMMMKNNNSSSNTSTSGLETKQGISSSQNPAVRVAGGVEPRDNVLAAPGTVMGTSCRARIRLSVGSIVNTRT